MKRRAFLGMGLGVGVLARIDARAAAARGQALRAEVVIVGGGVGGCAAALAVARAGLDVILTEETPWLGGQLTSQAVPPDEHPWIESFGCTRRYREFRDRVRAYYRDNYPLTSTARADARLNPGNGWVSRLCHEPRVALAVLESMLAPEVSGGRLRILRRHRPVAAAVDGDRMRGVRVLDEVSGRMRDLEGALFIDATETGELLALGGVEYGLGAESRAETGEAHAPEKANPANQQALTWCLAIDYEPGGDHVIGKPERYAFWREYEPSLKPAWPGRLLSWKTTDPIRLGERGMVFDPTGKATGPNLWTYRRLLDPGLFETGRFPTAISLVNWPQNDYLPGNVVDVGDEERRRHLEGARELSRSLLYWMQTEAPRPDGGTGWPGLRPRGDVTGTEDGLALAPYIRESRRLKAEVTILEQHVSAEQRAAGAGRESATAERYEDSVGVGAYRIDLHPSTGGDNYIDLSSLPFQIPMGALIPRRVENLLAGCKNIGTTHVTNGAYRLHPVEWNIGEAAGWLASFSKRRGEPPRWIRSRPELRREFQQRLRDQGVELEWPKLRPL